MKDLTGTIQDVLGKQLGVHGYDLVDLTPIPVKADPMIRFQTLQDALEEFAQSSPGEPTLSYIVQFRPKTQKPVEASAMLSLGKPNIEGIYLPNGKLNVAFLQKNAELLFASGEYGLARNIYNTIRMSGERSAPALYWIARCLEEEGKVDEAVLRYEESITYAPTLEAFQSLANIHISKKRDSQAAELMERALNMKDLSQEVRFQLYKSCGNAWFRAERYEMAERNYRRALELDSMADGIHANLGALHLQFERIEEAKKCFQEALSVNSKNDRALAGMGSCLLAEGEMRGAHDFFARSLDLHLNNPTSIYYLVKCAYEIKSYATAARIVEEYTQIAPINANLLYSLAGLQFHLGRMSQAKVTTKRILDLQPNHNGALELMRMIGQYEVQPSY
ncbi:tetratricopeptide repeat protein [bacterium]|jgi:tetratricopeptide (TPR) repeat protein|nr:tetratricopeptide repeat protein [bacterium]